MITRMVTAALVCMSVLTACSTTSNDTAEGTAITASGTPAEETAQETEAPDSGAVTPGGSESEEESGLVVTSRSPNPGDAQNPPFATFTLTCDGYEFPTYTEAWVTEFDDCSGLHVGGDATQIQSDAAAVANETALSEMSNRDVLGYLETLYAMCGQTGLESYDYLVADDPVREGQMREFQAMMMLCPEHPDAKEINSRIKAVEAIIGKPRTIFGNGTWKVGKEFAPGTYVSKNNDEGCYWERLDRKGNIIDNNFSNGSRMEVTINSSDYEFRRESCSKWKEQ